MKNTLGNVVTLTIFGESHGKYVGATLDGLMPGIFVDTEAIKTQLTKRRPFGKGETARVEQDHFEIISGVFNCYTTGSPLTIIIPNENVSSKDYSMLRDIARPSHADYTSFVKYNGYADYRGGGHFSGRITAAIVASGAILISALEKNNIYIGTHIKQIGNIVDSSFNGTKEEILTVNQKKIPLINNMEKEVTELIEKTALNKDSIGGILQTMVYGLPSGLGEPWFSSVEGLLANAMFSIGGIKGIEFGKGFDFVNGNGSTLNDAFVVSKNKITTKTNNNGGINGGITNGMPIIFNICVKPTPSIYKEQDTVNFKTLENVKLTIEGRHDPAIIRRIVPVINAITAITICDMLSMRYGNDFLNFKKEA